MDRSKTIFGNEMPSGVYNKAVRSKKKYIRKYGDDSGADYPVKIEKNKYIGDSLGVKNVLVGDLSSNAHYDPEANLPALDWDREKGIIPPERIFCRRPQAECIAGLG